ncbi:phage tail fiber protein [Kosakonia cowanii]
MRISSGTTDAVSLQVYTVYTDKNTSKASDGTLKAASPVARIVKSKKDCQRTDIDEEGFNWCGCGTANEEAEGISVSRLDTGVYTLTGSAGLASSGWQLLPPRDPQGSGDMGIVEAEQTESGGLTIRLYKRRYVLTDDGDIEVQKGAAIDVPVNSWIDVRLDMPETSLWNQRAAGNQEQ